MILCQKCYLSFSKKIFLYYKLSATGNFHYCCGKAKLLFTGISCISILDTDSTTSTPSNVSSEPVMVYEW